MTLTRSFFLEPLHFQRLFEAPFAPAYLIQLLTFDDFQGISQHLCLPVLRMLWQSVL